VKVKYIYLFTIIYVYVYYVRSLTAKSRNPSLKDNRSEESKKFPAFYGM